MERTYVLSREYLSTEIEGEIILMPVSSDKIKKESFFAIEGAGNAIMECIQKNKNLYEMVQLVVERFDVDERTAFEDISDFIAGLTEKGIIIENV